MKYVLIVAVCVTCTAFKMLSVEHDPDAIMVLTHLRVTTGAETVAATSLALLSVLAALQVVAMLVAPVVAPEFT
jgi:hypothetical protein